MVAMETLKCTYVPQVSPPCIVWFESLRSEEVVIKESFTSVYCMVLEEVVIKKSAQCHFC